MGQALNVITTSPWVDGATGTAFLLQEQLGITSNTCREVGWQGQGFIQGIGVQALGVTLGRGHRLNTGTGHIIKHILCSQAPTGGL